MVKKTTFVLLTSLAVGISFTSCEDNEEVSTDAILDSEIEAEELAEIDAENIMFNLTDLGDNITNITGKSSVQDLGVEVKKVENSILQERISSIQSALEKDENTATRSTSTFFTQLGDSTVTVSFFNGVNASLNRLFNTKGYTGEMTYTYNEATRTSTAFVDIVIDGSVSVVGVYQKTVNDINLTGNVKTMSLTYQENHFISYDDGRTANRNTTGTFDLTYVDDEIVSVFRDGTAFGQDVRGRAYDVTVTEPLFHSPSSCDRRFPISGVRIRTLTSTNGVTKEYTFDFGDNECNNNYDLSVITL